MTVSRLLFPVAMLLPLTTAFGATSVSQYGITWTFDRDYQTGQFVNGDYWVVGPVTIVSVSPHWDGEKNGSMLNPIPLAKQGYDSRVNMGFDPEARVSFPSTFTGVSSLISTQGLSEVKVGGAAEGLDTASVLTIVESPAPEGSFRPPYVAGAKPFFTTSQVRYDAAPLLPLPSGTVFPTLEGALHRVWLDHGPKVTGATIHPRNNMPPYPRDSSNLVSQVSLAVMTDRPDREVLINRMIQLGIDLYHISLNNGDAFRAYGGFGSGRKWPILFAGILLDNAEMRSPLRTISPSSSINKFGEDGHTYYGQPTPEYPEGKPLWGQDCSIGYTQPYFVNHDCRDPDGILEDKQMVNGGGYSICCTSYTWVGQALAARLMGAKELWDWPAFFDYVDRWIAEEGAYGSDFIKGMWISYREFSEGIVPTPTIESIHGSLSSIRIDWSHPIPDYIDGYSVYRATSPDGPYTQVSEAHAGQSFEDLDVTDGTRYWYRVTALMDEKESALTQPVESYLSNQWGHEDFEAALWTKDNGVLFNDIRWSIQSGVATRTNLTELTTDLNGYWLRPGLHHPEPALVVSHYPVAGDFVFTFDNYQKYGVANMGAILLFSDEDNHYKVEIARDRFRIHRVMGGVSTQIGSANGLGMQHAPSSARFEIDINRTENSIRFNCKKSNWHKYNTGVTDSNIYTLLVEDSDPAALETFVSGKIGFYQATVSDWNVSYYDNIVVTQTGSIESPPPTPTPTPASSLTPSPTPTLMPTPSPSSPGAPAATMTPLPVSGVHWPHVVFNSEAADGIELVILGQDPPVAFDAVGYKDNPTGILLNAFGESFLVDTVGSDRWMLTNSESQNVILVDDNVPGPVDSWMESGPSRSTPALPVRSLFTTGVSGVEVPTLYGALSTHLGGAQDTSFYSDRIRVGRHVFFPDRRFFVVLDDIEAVDGLSHTFSWLGHSNSALSFPMPNAVNLCKPSGNCLQVRFLGDPVSLESYSIPQDVNGDGLAEEVPYFAASRQGVGEQYLTVLFPLAPGDPQPSYTQIATPVGNAGRVSFAGVDYLAFAQKEPRQKVEVNGQVTCNARFILARSVGGELENLFAIGQSGPLHWNGSLVIDESEDRSFLFQKTENSVAITTLEE